MNTAIIGPAVAICLFFPKIGQLAAYFGAFSNLICTYSVPVFTYVTLKYQACNFQNAEDAGLRKGNTIAAEKEANKMNVDIQEEDAFN